MKAQPKTIRRIMNVGFFFMITIAASGTSVNGITKFESDGLKGPRRAGDVELRFEFYPTGPYDDAVVPIFMVVNQNGSAHGLRYQLRDLKKNIAFYEGTLPGPDVRQLFARVHAAFRLPQHRRDYDRRLIYESDGFYLALKQQTAKLKEMSGALETRPEEIRALILELSELWKKLREVPPAYGYLTSRPIEEDRLRSLKSKYKVDLTPIESLSGDLQSLLIPIVTQPLNFYPLTQAQYNQLKAGKLAVTLKKKGYELSLFLSAKETEPHKKE